jgi:hypothetical protein
VPATGEPLRRGAVVEQPRVSHGPSMDQNKNTF